MSAMRSPGRSVTRLVAAATVAFVALTMGALVWDGVARPLQAAQAIQSVPVDANSISGVVVNNGKPEPGVWVMTETRSLPTLFRKIVVTDDQGRFLVPDLPDAGYEVWARGYGLQDSGRVKAARGQRVELQVVNAASLKEAAQFYPSNY